MDMYSCFLTNQHTLHPYLAVENGLKEKDDMDAFTHTDCQ